MNQINILINILMSDSTTAKYFARNCVCEMRMVAHERFYWILPHFSLSQWVELTSTHWRSEIFSREILFAFMTHAYNYFARKFSHFAKKYRPWNQAFTAQWFELFYGKVRSHASFVFHDYYDFQCNLSAFDRCERVNQSRMFRRESRYSAHSLLTHSFMHIYQ